MQNSPTESSSSSSPSSLSGTSIPASALSDTSNSSPSSVQNVTRFSENDIMGIKFEITLEPVGMGVSGVVCSAIDVFTPKTVALKKLASPFESSVVAKHMFREVKLLKHLQHSNVDGNLITWILTLDCSNPSQRHFHLTIGRSVRMGYLVTDFLPVDLYTLIKTKILEDQFTQYFIYQIKGKSHLTILQRGLKYVHSAGVIHRDLKPENILVNENCDLRICDFGMARTQKAEMTGYMVARFYRAPEIMLTWRQYDEKVDIWSAACIFAETMIVSPPLPGKNHIDQFDVITRVLGTPPGGVISQITAEDYDPKLRPSAVETLKSSYLLPYHAPADEPKAPDEFDWSFLEADYSTDLWKSLMYSEVLHFYRGNIGSDGGNAVSSNAGSYAFE
ncbi:Mitogen-activated protein kinase HOG1 [Penicillium malachiteum]|uniref:Mitogen-activated protein kinase HOG1 n=1 Tax=Penicillium malachiteum TaxID=1324776 RepID=UPI002548CD75|nr:Mitogen-activated protein kinase HOG1 [Penicillium malachiteum]KAJ5725646.1 Mitogen-activated protein kinase HOG1 [Penicillium malachiteum]